MLRFGIEKLRRSSPSPVDMQLAAIADFEQNFPNLDDYVSRIRTYLQFAKDCGLSTQAEVASCIDLAETYTDIPELTKLRQAKIDAWVKARDTARKIDRAPVTIGMELDPIYFEAILKRQKTYEGRAYKPDSDKNYPDMRPGDYIRFRLSRRDDTFEEDAARRGLPADKDMVCTVKAVHFAPTVHGMYQIPKFNGLGFQPMIQGPSEFLQLQRAAVYHTFPGYHEFIAEHGFLGIEVERPHLVDPI